MKIKNRRVQIALVFCVAVIKEKAIRTHEERECAKRAKVMVVGKDKIKTRRILFAKVFSSVFNAGSNFEK